MKTHMLEINLISAQGLKVPTGKKHHNKTYAVVSIESTIKLRTAIDQLGGENPTWNDSFLFRVTDNFLSSDTSGISVEIYAVGFIRDTLIGTVRFLIGNCVNLHSGTPSCTSIQIRRPSGRFQGILNIAAKVMNGSDFSNIGNVTAIAYRDLMMGECIRRKSRKDRKEVSGNCSPASQENWASGSLCSEGGDSTSSSASSTPSALKEWNGVTNLAGTKGSKLTCRSPGLLCCLMGQMKTLNPLSSNENLCGFGGSPDRER